MIYSNRALRTMKKIGHDLSLSRRKRLISMKSLAERAGTSVDTIRRLERGDTKVAWGTVVAVLETLGQLPPLAEVADSSKDELGIGLMESALPKRIHSRKITPETGAI